MIKLYVLYGGDIICRDISQLNEGLSEAGEISLANPVFLVHHPKGWLLWDAGLPDDYLNQEYGVEAWIFHLSMKKTLISQLNELGMVPADIDYFAFSHIHNDHTGNANYFKSAKLIMQEKEYNVAFHPGKRPFNYADYKELANAETIKLNGDYDLFGDGTVQFISTPGHTPGHQSLMLNLKESGCIIISGDIAYYKSNFEKNAIPTFNTNKAESLASLEKIRQLVKQHNARLWIQHDKQHFETLKLCPDYYQ